MNRLLEFCKEYKIECREQASLADYCTFKIGGPAKLIILPKTEEEVIGVANAACDLHLPLTTIGKGSNILFSDSGYDGALIKLDGVMRSINLTEDDVIDCGSGVSLTRLCTFACEKGLTGLEFAYGIPGSVGGAVYMNAGAYGGEMKDVVVSTAHITQKGGWGVLQAAELDFSYRHSAYSGRTNIIISAKLALKKDDPAAIRARMEKYMKMRRDKQPLEYPSAGSTFKRPEGAYASELVDRCGLKGMAVGGAMVSEKHAGFLINYNNASAADMTELIRLVQNEVESKTGYKLMCEIEKIGF